MKLDELLRDECIRMGSTAGDKAMALCEIASLAKKSEVLKNVSEDAVLEALQEREILGTTAFGHGIAIPHCRMKGITDFVVGILTVPDGVEFESEDAHKVNLLVFIISPEDNSDAHVRLLSSVSQSLQNAEIVQKMTNSPDIPTLRSYFLEAAQAEVTDQLPLARNLVHIFIQDKTIFQEILESLCAVEGLSLSVLDGCSSRSYLNRISQKKKKSLKKQDDFKCIIAIVEQSLSNEIIRRVETVTGSLLQCMGVMVTIQELSYSAGSLEI